MSFLLKVVLSALLIGVISEVGRRHASVAAFLAALPLISLLSILWLYQETHDSQRIAEFSQSVFWYVVPSLIFFVLLPVLLLRAHTPFYLALLFASAATIAGFFAMRAVLGRFGITF
jgi:hypothetical protein